MDARLAAKLALEAEVLDALTQAAKVYITDWANSGGIMQARNRMSHQHSIEVLLVRHYARVCAVMLGMEPDDEGDLLEVTTRRHAERLATRARMQSDMICRGIDREIAKAGVEVDQEKASPLYIERKDSFGSFTIKLAAKLVEQAKKAFAAVTKKLPATANVQTQEPAEEAIYDWVEDHKADSTIINVWSTMLDERVREWHQEAEGQERRVDQPFDVGGEQLRFPGDMSLGASLRNVINCRCAAVFYAVDADGNRREFGLPTPRVPTRRYRRPNEPRTPQTSQLKPTELVTLNGTTNARVVLGNGRTIATMRQTSPSTITVTSGGRQIARAEHSNGTVTNIVVGAEYQSLGIDKLIRRSVEHSFARRR